MAENRTTQCNLIWKLSRGCADEYSTFGTRKKSLNDHLKETYPEVAKKAKLEAAAEKIQ